MEEAEPVEVPEKASIGMQMRGVDPLSAVEAVMTVKVLLLLWEANVGISSSLPSVS